MESTTLDARRGRRIIGAPKTHHFFDFGILEPVPTPQNHLFLSLETPGHLKSFEKTPGAFVEKYILLMNIRLREILYFIDVGKDGHRKMIKEIR